MYMAIIFVDLIEVEKYIGCLLSESILFNASDLECLSLISLRLMRGNYSNDRPKTFAMLKLPILCSTEWQNRINYRHLGYFVLSKGHRAKRSDLREKSCQSLVHDICLALQNILMSCS